MSVRKRRKQRADRFDPAFVRREAAIDNFLEDMSADAQDWDMDDWLVEQGSVAEALNGWSAGEDWEAQSSFD